jgi:hypothetical protein
MDSYAVGWPPHPALTLNLIECLQTTVVILGGVALSNFNRRESAIISNSDP